MLMPLRVARYAAKQSRVALAAPVAGGTLICIKKPLATYVTRVLRVIIGLKTLRLSPNRLSRGRPAFAF